MHLCMSQEHAHDMVTCVRHQHLRPREDMGLELSQEEELAEMEETSGWVYARGIMVFADVY